MKAVLQTGQQQPWAELLGDIAWPLLPVGNRPFLEYWIEECIDLGIRDIRIVLGEGAEQIEAYAGEGERWGVSISYSFLKEGKAQDSFLRRAPSAWRDGLFYLRAPVFLHRRQPPGETPAGFPGGVFVNRTDDGSITCLLSNSREVLSAFIANPLGPPSGKPFTDLGLTPVTVRSVKDYYDLNMSLVGEEAARHVRAGYALNQNVSIGFNVIMPPSVTVTPPVAIGNDSRIGAMSSVGPMAVIGNQVIIDRQSELSDCVILDGTYIGRGMEIQGKIVAGCRLIDPESEAVAEINDPWLVAPVRPMVKLRDVLRAVTGWSFALGLMLLQAGPFAILYPLIKITRAGRFRAVSVHLGGGRVGPIPEYVPSRGRMTGLGNLFQALNLDLFPRFWHVVRGHLWLCGVRPMASPGENAIRAQVKEYFPGVLVYDTDVRENADMGGHLAHALYYARFRSLFEDIKMALALLLVRPLRFLSSSEGSR